MNGSLKTRVALVIGLAATALLSGCETASYGVSTGYYGGGGWYDPYHYRPCCYGGVVVRPPPSYRPPSGSRPGRPANLPSMPSRPPPMPRPALRR
jgi:hypothetical protein